MEREGIEHRTVEVNGIKMHVAEKGEGPVVLFLHGFPELWYSWRHQIISLAARGYRAIAPDLRGYGDTEAPSNVAAYSIFHLVGDIVALIDSLGQEQVFVVGQDWGAIVAWSLCAFRPDKGDLRRRFLYVQVPVFSHRRRMIEEPMYAYVVCCKGMKDGFALYRNQATAEELATCGEALSGMDDVWNPQTAIRRRVIKDPTYAYVGYVQNRVSVKAEGATAAVSELGFGRTV